jgi:serine O-acetyltransferase
VGEGTVIGADPVLTRSTGAWEVSAGVPARKIADRR